MNRPCFIVWLSLSALLLGGCGKPKVAPLETKLVQTVRAEPVGAGRTGSEPAYIGIVRADNETDFSFKVGGIVDLIGPEPGRDWDEGTTLKAGDMLARLKQVDFVNTAASARARAELDGKTEERLRGLRAKDAISQQELDVAQANKRTAEALRNQAEQNLTDSQLVAPFEGVVLARYVNGGVTVSAGQRVLRYANTSVMKVEVGVPDRMVSRFLPDKEIDVEVSALEGRPPFRGRVSEVGVAASPESRLYRVVIKVGNTNGLLRSGMTATVPVGDPLPASPGAVRVPLSSLVTMTSEASGGAPPRLAVFVVEGRSAIRRPVKTGDIVDSSIIVTEGLRVGDEVVTSGVSFLYDGAPVEVLRSAGRAESKP